MEFEAKPPSALYKEAGKFLVLNTIDVMTFFFVLIFLLSFEKTKNLVILFFESSKFFFKIFNPYIFEDNSEPIAAKFSFFSSEINLAAPAVSIKLIASNLCFLIFLVH